MRGIERPLIIYTSRKPFHDRCAEDMKCGDLDEKTLKERFGLYRFLNASMVILSRNWLFRPMAICRF